MSENQTTAGHPLFDVPATIALLTKAAELDPEAWAAPLPDRFSKRRTDSVWRAKAELEGAIDAR